MTEFMTNTEGICLHIFDAYKVVDKDGVDHPLNGQVNVPIEGTHYGHCYLCKKWVDLTHARIAT